jgi:hypothetical protein
MRGPLVYHSIGWNVDFISTRTVVRLWPLHNRVLWFVGCLTLCQSSLSILLDGLHNRVYSRLACQEHAPVHGTAYIIRHVLLEVQLEGDVSEKDALHLGGLE